MALKSIGIAIFSISVLISFGLTSNQAFAGSPAEECEASGGVFDPNTMQCNFPVGGIAVVVPESELYGELAKQYSLWLIPAISAAGIGAYIIKRKF